MLHSRHQLVFIVLAWSAQKALGGEIIKGTEVPDSSMEYMASVQKNGKHHCGGFLIAKNIVLTAAHCIEKVSMLSVVLGTHDLDCVNERMRYKIKKTCQHPAYKDVLSGNDIMMLTLAGTSKIKPIQLPKKNTKLKVNANCLVAGWGYVVTNGRSVNKLMGVNVNTVDRTTCQKKWSTYNKSLPDNIICAGGYPSDKGFCKGDSGGPLVYNKTAVGIVSFNINKNCTYPNVPNVYTEILHFVDWIKSLKATCKID